MPSQSATPHRYGDAFWAFILLRLFLGLRLLHAFWYKCLNDKGVFNLDYLKGFSVNVIETFHGKIPDFLLIPYAYGLPWVELIISLMLILGVRTRVALIAMGIVYLSLGFGQMVMHQWSMVTDIAVHLALTIAAILLLRANQFELVRDR